VNYDEAAAILGLPVGTIRSRPARARQTLRKTFNIETRNRLQVARQRRNDRREAATNRHDVITRGNGSPAGAKFSFTLGVPRASGRPASPIIHGLRDDAMPVMANFFGLVDLR